MPYQVPCGQAQKNDKILEPVCDSMEVVFQRRCANFIYVVPEGLRELLTDISREVFYIFQHKIVFEYLFLIRYVGCILEI